MSNIEWTDTTWNPVVGCTPVSPGCLNCYAATMARRLEAMGRPEYAWPKAKRDAVRLIGNAVHVAVARALVEASLPRQRAGWSKKRRAAALLRPRRPC